MSTRHLREERAQIVAEMRSLNDNNPGDLQGKALDQWNALQSKLSSVEGQLDRQAVLDDAERRQAGQPLKGSFASLKQGVGLMDAIRAQMGASDTTAGRAREVSQELELRSGRKAQGLYWDMGCEHRTITTNTPAEGPGGTLIPTDYRPELFIDRLRNATKVRSLGASLLSGLSGNVTIPRRKTSVVAGWVAENTPLPESDASFDSISLSPKHAGAIMQWSRNMVQQASPDIETLCRNDMALTLAETLDYAAILGAGTNNEPTGVLNTKGISEIATSDAGRNLTYDDVADLVGLVDDANANGSAVGFLTNSQVRRQAAKLKTTQGEPLGLNVIFQGKPLAVTNIIPATMGKGKSFSPLIYANWSDLLIGVWSELDILVNPYEADAYSKGNVSIRAMMTVDINVRHPESFAVIRDINA